MARLKFVENSLHAISSKEEKILQGLKEASAFTGGNTAKRSPS